MRAIVCALLLLPACVNDKDNARCLFNCQVIETIAPTPASAASAAK